MSLLRNADAFNPFLGNRGLAALPSHRLLALRHRYAGWLLQLDQETRSRPFDLAVANLRQYCAAVADEIDEALAGRGERAA